MICAIFAAVLMISFSCTNSCPFRCSCYSSIKFRLVANCSSVGESNLLAFNFSSSKSETIGALYLSDNKISFLYPGIFSSFVGLKLLDLSSNDIRSVEVQAFKGLENSLEILNLSNNPLNLLVKKSFGKLKRLSFIQVATNSIVCDCNLRSFVKLLKERRINLSADSKCALPKKFQNKHIQAVPMKNFTCDAIKLLTSKTSLSIRPSSSKVLVEGDSFEIFCSAEIFSHQQTMEWFLNETPIDEKAVRNIAIKTLFGDQLQTSTLKIDKIQLLHQGMWTCRLETDDAFTEKSINVTAWLQNRTCKSEDVLTEKGMFSWKETINGQTDNVPCPYWTNDTETSRKSARRLCNLSGKWEQPVTTDCSYSSKFVSILLEIDKDFPSDDGALIELANLTKNRSFIASADITAVGVLLNIIENKMQIIKPENVPNVIQIINSLMDADRSLFIDNEKNSRRFSERILRILKKLPISNVGVSLTFSNIAFCETFISSTNFNGIFAGYFSEPTKQFLCVPTPKMVADSDFPEPVAAVEFPNSLLSSDSDKVTNISLRFLWFRTMLFFPDQNLTSCDQNQNILGAYLGDSLFLYNSINISAYPLRIRWRKQQSISGYHVARWFQTGKVWESAECSENVAQESIFFDCPLSFGFFTLLNEKLPDANFLDPLVLPPWMIVASGFLVICLLVAMIFHCSSKNIGLSVKFRHCLINFWLSTSLLTLLLALGINQVHFKYICLCVSVGFHFLLLLNWFWMLLLSRTIHRKLSKIVYPRIKSEDDNEEPKDKVRRAKLVGMYSLAIGLSVMPCAFTLALSRTADYVGHSSICFLVPGMAMVGALVVPCSAVAVTSVLLLLRSSCLLFTLSRRSNVLTVGEDAGSEVNEDLQTLTVQTLPPADAVSLASSCMDDQQFSVGRHLAVVVTVLILTSISMASVSLYVWQEPANYFLELGFIYYDLAVGCLYSTAAVLLGGLVLWFYVLKRPESSEMCFSKKVRKSSKCKKSEATNGHVTHRQFTKVDSPLEDTCLLDSTHSPRKVNAGVVTKFDADCSESRHSVTTGSVVDANSKYYRYQRAVARKFYDKRRSVRGDSQSLSEQQINDSCSSKLPKMSTSLTDDNCAVPKDHIHKRAKDLSTDDKNKSKSDKERKKRMRSSAVSDQIEKASNGFLAHESLEVDLPPNNQEKTPRKNNETCV